MKGQKENAAEQLTPYDVLRMKNSKTYKFQKSEMYPNIRPPVSQCNPEHESLLLSNTMEDNGCGYFDPKSLTQRRIENNLENDKMRSREVSNRNYQCQSDGQPGKQLQKQFQSKDIDWNQVTPYDLMRIQNSKTFNYEKCEKYPSIRPPKSECNPGKNVEWLNDFIEQIEPDDVDVMDVWKKIPRKDTLGFYGVGSKIHRPEAVVFNQMIAKCLDKAGGVKPKYVETRKRLRTTPAKIPVNLMHPPNMFVLNRRLLESKIQRMPTVKRKLKANDAFTWMHCARQTESGYPFVDKKSGYQLEAALDMEKKTKSPRHGLRRKFTYCELQCGIKENKCTDYEWRKYKQDPLRYEEAYRKEMEEIQEKTKVEPKNYEELYAQLVSCFKRDRRPNPIYDAFEKCCDGFPKYGDDGKGDGGDGHGSFGDTDSDGFGDGEEGDGDGQDGKRDTGEDDDLDKTDGDGPGAGDAKVEIKDDGKGHGNDGAGKGGKGDGNKKKPGHGGKTDKSDGDDRQDTDGKKDFSRSSNDDDSKNKRPLKPPKKPGKSDVVEDCPCDDCKFMNRKEAPQDPGYISEMKKEEKRRQLRDYLKQMCHRQYMKTRKPEYRAPQRKCQEIDCQTCFCQNPKLAEYCDCLDAMQNLQKVLGSKHRIVNNEILFNVKDLRDRICRRLCECL